MLRPGFIVGFMLVSGTALAAETLVVPPYPAAAPWKQITDKHDAQQVWDEWIPADQSPDDVHDILTEQIFYAQKGQNPSDFVSGLFKRIGLACAGTRINGPAAQTENGYSVAYGQVYCVDEKDAGKDVDIFVKVIGGKDALYVVQREFRRPAVAGAVPGMRTFSKDQKAEALAALVSQKVANDFLVSQVKLCADDANGDCLSAATKPAPVDNNDVSASFGFAAGKTTADEVEDKLGQPDSQNSMGDRHEYMYMNIKGLIVMFLFGKDNILIRTMAYSHP